MSFSPAARPARLALAAGLVLALTSAAPASAARFSQPVAIPERGEVGTPLVAIAPNGRTAVLYRRTLRNKRPEFRAAIGSHPGRLGRPTTVQAGWRSAVGGYAAPAPQLLARPDGGFVACFPDVSRNRTAVVGCSLASPTGGFGPLQVVLRQTAPGRPSVAAVVRPDSSVVALLTQSTFTGDGQAIGTVSSVATLAADGRLDPPRAFERPEDELTPGTPLAVTTDGTVAMPARIPSPAEQHVYLPGIRIMPPGSDRFGPVIPVGTEPFDHAITLEGRDELLIRFDTREGNVPNSLGDGRVVRRRADGQIAPAGVLPGGGFNPDRSAIVPLPSGELLGVIADVSTADGDSDCFNPVSGVVSASTVGASLPTSAGPGRLSTRGQIALSPEAAVLDNGTVIASWQNAAGWSGARRLEVAVRQPGAATFARPQALPRLLSEETLVLTAGGNHAALAWNSQGTIVVSALRASGPYAKPSLLPRRPAAPCNE